MPSSAPDGSQTAACAGTVRPVPELPEVETIRAQLEPRLSGRSITDAGSHPSAKFTPALDAIGGEVTAVRRRGKYLILDLDEPADLKPADSLSGSSESTNLAPDGTRGESGCELVVHLGMTGRLSVSPAVDLAHPHLRAWWRLDGDDVLTLHDMRRFGRVHVVPAGRYETIATLHRLGPEPFSDEFTGDGLWRALSASQRRIKTQLLSQRPVAGVGNIYADEALWLAQINPSVRYVSRPRAGRLADAIRTALASGLRHGGTTLRDYAALDGEQGRNQHHLHCYGRAGEPCERCGTELRRRVVDARGTTWCPHCQNR